MKVYIVEPCCLKMICLLPSLLSLLLFPPPSLPSSLLPLSLQNVSPEDYRLTSRIPAGCTPTVDCSYFVGIQTNTNSSFLDIYLEGDSQGWVAVGFSSSANMVSWLADLLCTGKVQIQFWLVQTALGLLSVPPAGLDNTKVCILGQNTELAIM